MPHIGRYISCGLFGHSYDDFQAENETGIRVIQDYQLMLYGLVDEQIHAGMRHFYAPLESGVALWMAEYVLCQKRAMATTGIELHLLTNKTPSASQGYLIDEMIECASAVHILSVEHRMDYFRELMKHCSKIITVERCGTNEILRTYARSEGVTVVQRNMPENGEPYWQIPCWG